MPGHRTRLLTLAGAILLTVYSLVVYLYHYRTLLKGGG